MTAAQYIPNYTVLHGGEAATDGLYENGRQIADWRDLDRLGYSVAGLFNLSQAQLRKLAGQVHASYRKQAVSGVMDNRHRNWRRRS